MFIRIDNYDSFTWNLWHFLSDLGAEVEIVRNDATTVEAVLARKPQGIILSPGPGIPEQAGISVDLIRAAAGKVPVLGVCQGIRHLLLPLGAACCGLTRRYMANCQRLCKAAPTKYAVICSPIAPPAFR